VGIKINNTATINNLMFNKIANILINSTKNNNFIIMVKKLIRRFETDSKKESKKWANENSISLDDYCNKINSDIWKESIDACNKIKLKSNKTLSNLNSRLGGAGAYPLIYFHCRILNPDVVVETGVGVGWSSFAILESLKVNGNGQLFSSDFPYFRIKNPEQYIGAVVPESIRNNWFLDIRGDEIAIPRICEKVKNIDLFHYDSDKSYAGRLFAIRQIQKKLSSNSIVIFDDIEDNLFFKNLVEYLNCEYQVFEFAGKFAGQLKGIDLINQENINI